jgi:Uri superfamily endonuclease
MDYLRPCGRVTEIWYGRRDAVNDEHRWAACLQTLAGTDPVAPGFGSSDCSCDTHLVRFDSRPDIALFRRRLPRAPGQTRSPVYRLPINGLWGVKR